MHETTKPENFGPIQRAEWMKQAGAPPGWLLVHETEQQMLRQKCAASVAISSRCNQDLMSTGKAYPRTCAECGLGPCRVHLRPVLSLPVPNTAEELQTLRVRVEQMRAAIHSAVLEYQTMDHGETYVEISRHTYETLHRALSDNPGPDWHGLGCALLNAFMSYMETSNKLMTGRCTSADVSAASTTLNGAIYDWNIATSKRKGIA